MTGYYTPQGITAVDATFKQGSKTFGNKAIFQPDWDPRFPFTQEWDFSQNVLVGLEVWKTDTAIHGLNVIKLDTQCESKAIIAESERRGAESEDTEDTPKLDDSELGTDVADAKEKTDN